MGLRFLISLNTRGTDKVAGDPVNVRLAGAPIGIREAKEFLVLDVANSEYNLPKFAGWDCAGLEKRLQDMKAAGEPLPVITHPLAVYETPAEIEGELAPPKMVLRSLKRVDIEALPDKNDIKDKGKVVAPKAGKDVAIINVTKPKDTHTDLEVAELVKEHARKKILGK